MCLCARARRCLSVSLALRHLSNIGDCATINQVVPYLVHCVRYVTAIVVLCSWPLSDFSFQLQLPVYLQPNAKCTSVSCVILSSEDNGSVCVRSVYMFWMMPCTISGRTQYSRYCITFSRDSGLNNVRSVVIRPWTGTVCVCVCACLLTYK